ncbi:putative Adenylate cyclase [Paratrimastix pyriformis]|uniref:Adenylate cyclase n=1 Tax=Paratrimastix pyriformis TaxID=342808 RepID=A0ABQ8URU7_9EUKA|nr:putative Adenylate cyclase [Paratrimastix pyriformis]
MRLKIIDIDFQMKFGRLRGVLQIPLTVTSYLAGKYSGQPADSRQLFSDFLAVMTTYPNLGSISFGNESGWFFGLRRLSNGEFELAVTAERGSHLNLFALTQSGSVRYKSTVSVDIRKVVGFPSPLRLRFGRSRGTPSELPLEQPLLAPYISAGSQKNGSLSRGWYDRTQPQSRVYFFRRVVNGTLAADGVFFAIRTDPTARLVTEECYGDPYSVPANASRNELVRLASAAALRDRGSYNNIPDAPNSAILHIRSSNGTRYHARAMRIRILPGLDWILFSVIPPTSAEVYSKRATTIATIISVILAILTLLGGVALVRVIQNSLGELRDRLHQVNRPSDREAHTTLPPSPGPGQHPKPPKRRWLRVRFREVVETEAIISLLQRAVTLMYRYLPPTLARLLMEQPATQPILAGMEERRLTVLFVDIQRFTALAEKLSPEELFQVLNSILGAVSAVVNQHQGTIDKFMGDAVMVFWNAPFPQEHHERLACECALDIVEAIKNLPRPPDVPPLRVRVGIHTGQSLVGNVGAQPLRMDYTVLSDTVNCASRLEDFNRVLGTCILISEEVARAVPDMHIRPLGKAGGDVSRARTEASSAFFSFCGDVCGDGMPIFELVGASLAAASPEERHLTELQQALIGALRGSDFRRAVDLAEEIEEEWPHYLPARLQARNARRRLQAATAHTGPRAREHREYGEHGECTMTATPATQLGPAAAAAEGAEISDGGWDLATISTESTPGLISPALTPRGSDASRPFHHLKETQSPVGLSVLDLYSFESLLVGENPLDEKVEMPLHVIGEDDRMRLENSSFPWFVWDSIFSQHFLQEHIRNSRFKTGCLFELHEERFTISSPVLKGLVHCGQLATTYLLFADLSVSVAQVYSWVYIGNYSDVQTVLTFVKNAHQISSFQAAFDLALLVLDRDVGDEAGYLGVVTFKDEWLNQPIWADVGYPLPEDLSQDSYSMDGIQSFLMRTTLDLTRGNSGGGVWGWFEGEQSPRLIGVVSSESKVTRPCRNTPSRPFPIDRLAHSFFILRPVSRRPVKYNNIAGGPAMTFLVAYGRAKFDPKRDAGEAAPLGTAAGVASGPLETLTQIFDEADEALLPGGDVTLSSLEGHIVATKARPFPKRLSP